MELLNFLSQVKVGADLDSGNCGAGCCDCGSCISVCESEGLEGTVRESVRTVLTYADSRSPAVENRNRNVGSTAGKRIAA